MKTTQGTTFHNETARIEAVVRKVVDNKSVFGAVLSVSKGEKCWTVSAGDLSNDTPYFIASTTKLYITAIILKHRAEHKLALDDKISCIFRRMLCRNCTFTRVSIFLRN